MKFSLARHRAARRWSVVATAKGLPGARRSSTRGARFFAGRHRFVWRMRKLPFDTDSPLSAELHFALALGSRRRGQRDGTPRRRLFRLTSRTSSL